LAGLLNALKLVGKDLPAVKITFIGCGAAGVACSRLLFTAGATPGLCKMVDSRGILHQNRTDICKRKNEFVDKWKLCQITNAGQRQGGIPEAMQGVDVVIALSKPDANTIQPAWVKTMARDSIIFACANPIPEIWPWDAKAAGVGVVATGRSDFPNQVNNSLGFPGIFRGTLDVRAKTISEQMCLAAAVALSNHISSDQLKSGRILPTMEDWQVFPKVAAAVAVQAVAEGLARISLSYEQAHHQALTLIQQARDLTQLMMKEKFID
jgi:malate dehydrogenase (oxaloacetate-decarboxylating)